MIIRSIVNHAENRQSTMNNVIPPVRFSAVYGLSLAFANAHRRAEHPSGSALDWDGGWCVMTA